MGREKKSELSKFKIRFEETKHKPRLELSRESIRKYYMDRRAKRRHNDDTRRESKFRKIISKTDSFFNWLLS